jgi:hypothetical protein
LNERGIFQKNSNKRASLYRSICKKKIKRKPKGEHYKIYKMRLKHYLIFAAICLQYNAAKSQTEESSKNIRISNVFLQSNMVYFKENGIVDNQICALAPNSKLIQQSKHLKDFSKSGYDFMTIQNAFSLLLGIDLNEKKNMQLRVGFNYGAFSLISSNYFQEEKFRIDTLNSQNSNRNVYIDSIVSNTYNVNYKTEQLRLDASLIFRRNPAARWSIYGGFGLMSGLSLNARTSVNHTQNTRIKAEETDQRVYNPDYSNLYDVETEVFQNKTNFSIATYIPLGLNFRIGNKRDFWKQTHLYYELSPGIKINSIPEIGTLTNAFFQQCIGLRFDWN